MLASSFLSIVASDFVVVFPSTTTIDSLSPGMVIGIHSGEHNKTKQTCYLKICLLIDPKPNKTAAFLCFFHSLSWGSSIMPRQIQSLRKVSVTES